MPRALATATSELRETLAGGALVVRFAVFVAAILAAHHLRLWPGAAARQRWLAGRGAPAGSARPAGSASRP